MYRKWELLTVLLPTVLIGGFEYIRHHYLLRCCLSMSAGNIVITILTFLLSALFATWMFRIIRRTNKQLAEEQARLAVYEERERLARELHDGIAQTIFFLNVKVQQGKTDEVRTALTMIDNQVRQAIFNLRALPEEGASLPARLDRWFEQWSALTGIDMQQDLDELPDGFFTPAEEVLLFSVIQEACNNIRKHSRAQTACIRLHLLEPAGWELSVTDDGRGMKSLVEGQTTYGVTMMAERADKLGATFTLRPREPRGTELVLRKMGGRSK